MLLEGQSYLDAVLYTHKLGMNVPWDEPGCGETSWGDWQWISKKEAEQRTSNQPCLSEDGQRGGCSAVVRSKLMLRLPSFLTVAGWELGSHWDICCNEFSSSS